MKFKIWLENVTNSYIFFDLDETLVHTENASVIEDKKQTIEKMKGAGSEISPNFKARILGNAEKYLAIYKKAIPIKIATPQETLNKIVMPRPHLQECLQRLATLAQLCILTSSNQLYAKTIIDTLHLGDFFSDRIYSTGGLQPPAVAQMNVPWVIVDDLRPGIKFNSLGAGVNFEHGDYDEVQAKMEQLERDHYIYIKGFKGEENDNELETALSTIAVKKKLYGA